MTVPHYDSSPSSITARHGKAPLTGKGSAEGLAARLVEEMIHRWQRGERPRAEEYLARHPELWDCPEAAADLIYEEVCLRQEHGEEVHTDEVLHRFPRWAAQLEVLLDCQRVLGPRVPAPRFPAAGETLGDFLLLNSLGRGGQGRVFLAGELSLGGRPVVLKLTPRDDGREHLALARLQHSYIVPLYSVQDHPSHGLRALCMPYFGGATLAQVLEALSERPLAARTARDVLAALDRLQAAVPVASSELGPNRQALAQVSYTELIGWIGVCLAEALQYAHDRGLVHLDLKPSNVLLTADGQPMLLDFHVSRQPLSPDEPAPAWLGGTPAYMPPEQQAALAAVRAGRPVPTAVDGRADVYALGVLLHEALAGALPGVGEKLYPLPSLNPQVSVGLADIVGKCLAVDPRQRYARSGAVADDLRRHLLHQPLRGVRNRSLGERYRKWRRRQPRALALGGMLSAVVIAACAVGLGLWSHYTRQLDQARAALSTGQEELARGHHEEAESTFQRGQGLAQGMPFQHDLAEELRRQADRARQAHAGAERARTVQELHALAERLRFLYGVTTLPPAGLRRLAENYRVVWAQRFLIRERLSAGPQSEAGRQVRDDLLDLALLWADLLAHLGPADDRDQARQEASTVLAEAEELLGPSTFLDRPQTAWEYDARGRSLLRSGDLAGAAAHFEQAVALQPQGLWPNYYHGICAYRRGHYMDAVAAFSVCIGAAPEAAGSFYNRALAYAALGRNRQALQDYDHALQLDPLLADGFLNRGMLHYQEKRYGAAATDLRRALELGVSPAVGHYDLALVQLALEDRTAAIADLRLALQHDPEHAEARKLLASLQPGR